MAFAEQVFRQEPFSPRPHESTASPPDPSVEPAPRSRTPLMTAENSRRPVAPSPSRCTPQGPNRRISREDGRSFRERSTRGPPPCPLVAAAQLLPHSARRRKSRSKSSSLIIENLPSRFSPFLAIMITAQIAPKGLQKKPPPTVRPAPNRGLTP